MADIAYKYLAGQIDLIHRGSIVVADKNGNTLYKLGDEDRITFARSSAKPIQAIPAIESGAVDAYGLTERELALLCASHNAEPFHVDAVRSILAKAGLNEGALRCGAQYPMYVPAEDELKIAGIKRAPVYSDCSGKHSGMLITAKFKGESLDDYYLPDHPVQKRILSTIADVCNIDERDIFLGTDGCGVPVHGMPLRKFAEGFARMSSPDGFFAPERARAIKRIISAMTGYPEMVAGTGRFCTELMQAFGGRLFGKSGAAAFYAIGVPSRGWGIVAKMDEGASSIIPYAILETLVQTGVITRGEADAIPLYSDKHIYNSKRQLMGEYRAVFELEGASSMDIF